MSKIKPLLIGMFMMITFAFAIFSIISSMSQSYNKQLDPTYFTEDYSSTFQSMESQNTDLLNQAPGGSNSSLKDCTGVFGSISCGMQTVSTMFNFIGFAKDMVFGGEKSVLTLIGIDTFWGQVLFMIIGLTVALAFIGSLLFNPP